MTLRPLFDRVSSFRPSRRGENHAFTGTRNVAGSRPECVVLPSAMNPSVVRAQLAFEVLVAALGTSTLLDSADDLLSWNRLRQGGQHISGDARRGRGFSMTSHCCSPRVDDAVIGRTRIIANREASARRVPCRQVTLR